MKVLNKDREEWIRIIQDNPAYCFFNSPYWYDVQSKYSHNPYTIKRLKCQNGLILLPLFKFKIKRLFTIAKTSEFGTYSSLITNFSVNDKGQQAKLLEKLLADSNFDYEGNPFLFNDLEQKESFTQIIDLANYDFKNISNNHRRSIKKARSYNLEVAKSENIKDWEKYFSIYEEVIQLRGQNATNKYQWELFDLIHRLPEMFRSLWLIKENKNIIGGAIVFYFNITSYWHGCNSERSKQIGGSHLLHDIIINDSKTKGFKIYDMNPSGGHLGVQQFKEGFMPTTIYYNKIEGRTRLYNSILKLYNLLK